MEKWQGNLSKMRTEVDENNFAQYYLSSVNKETHLNPIIGSTITIKSLGQINCVHCGRVTKKSFQQGYCYPCFRNLAQCDTCIIKPEKCHYEQGTCREPKWGEEHCLQDHFVYLANTGAIKVGITRHVCEGVSSRWLDQGATQAMAIYRVQDRKTSGLVETIISQHISDKTNWRTMLKGEYSALNLTNQWETLLEQVKQPIEALINKLGIQSITELKSSPVDIHYPILDSPKKIKSLNLEKHPEFTGQLLGIKGQYLMFDDDRVFNVRNAAGYLVNVKRH